MSDPRWMDCTVSEWEKKAELATKNGNMGEALKYADYANCRDMYDGGTDVETIQSRFGGSDE